MLLLRSFKKWHCQTLSMAHTSLSHGKPTVCQGGASLSPGVLACRLRLLLRFTNGRLGSGLLTLKPLLSHHTACLEVGLMTQMDLGSTESLLGRAKTVWIIKYLKRNFIWLLGVHVVPFYVPRTVGSWEVGPRGSRQPGHRSLTSTICASVSSSGIWG